MENNHRICITTFRQNEKRCEQGVWERIGEELLMCTLRVPSSSRAYIVRIHKESEGVRKMAVHLKEDKEKEEVFLTSFTDRGKVKIRHKKQGITSVIKIRKLSPST